MRSVGRGKIGFIRSVGTGFYEISVEVEIGSMRSLARGKMSSMRLVGRSKMGSRVTCQDGERKMYSWDQWGGRNGVHEIKGMGYNGLLQINGEGKWAPWDQWGGEVVFMRSMGRENGLHEISGEDYIRCRRVQMPWTWTNNMNMNKAGCPFNGLSS